MSTDMINKEQSQLPSYLIDLAKAGGQTGLEEMTQFLTPPRLKIMQPMKGDGFDQFPVGTVIVTPTNEVVCDLDGVFGLTVLYTYSQFCVHNPYNRPKDMFLIREATFDFNSEIAQKCLAFTREPMPENPQEELIYATHINALIIVHGVPAIANTPIMLSQYIGEWKSGRRMLDLLKARTQDGTPIYCHNLMAKSSIRTREKNKWYGLDFSNPTGDVDCGRFVPSIELVQAYGKMHEECKANKERFTVKYDEDEAVVAGNDGEVKSDTL